MTNIGSPVFKIGVILLVFHTDGNLPPLRNLLKIMQIKKERIFLHLKRKKAVIPSGPEPRTLDVIYNSFKVIFNLKYQFMMKITYPLICMKGKRNSISLWYFQILNGANGFSTLFNLLMRLIDTRKLSRKFFQRVLTLVTVNKHKKLDYTFLRKMYFFNFTLSRL